MFSPDEKHGFLFLSVGGDFAIRSISFPFSLMVTQRQPEDVADGDHRAGFEVPPQTETVCSMLKASVP